MSVISILRDTPNNVSIVRMIVTDTIAQVATAGYIESQMDEIKALNSGFWQWFASDFVICNCSDGNAIFTFTNSTFASLQIYGGSGGPFLPLAGGTLTGALIGTSADFSTVQGNWVYRNKAATFDIAPVDKNFLYVLTSSSVAVQDGIGLSGFPNGYIFAIKNIAVGNGSFVPFPGDLIDGQSSKTIPPQNGVYIVKTATQWSTIASFSDADIGDVTPAEVQSSSFNRFTAAGTSTAYTGSISPVPTLANGLWVVMTPNNTNTTTTPTLNLNGTGAKTIFLQSGAPIAVGDMILNSNAILYYSVLLTGWVLINPVVSYSASPLTTKGDLYTFSTVDARLAAAVGDGKILQINSAAATGLAWSTPTYPSASGTARKIIVSDGTNNIYSTETWAVPGSSGNVLTSDGTNWTSAAPSGGSAVIVAGTGVNSMKTTFGNDATALRGIRIGIDPFDATSRVLGADGIGIGSCSYVGTRAICMGYTARAQGTDSICLGTQAFTNNGGGGGTNCIALGTNSSTGARNNSLVISTTTAPSAPSADGQWILDADDSFKLYTAGLLRMTLDVSGNLILPGVIQSTTAIQSSAGLNALTFTYTASAVNYVNITSGATGNGSQISFTGSDGSVVGQFASKGGNFKFYDTTGANSGLIRFMNAANTFGTSLRAGANVANLDLQLPIADGSANAPLITDGSGNLSFLPGAWTTFTPTCTGFTGTPTTEGRFKLIGKTCFVFITVSGTSNATGFSITNLPATAANTTADMIYTPGQITNNSVISVAPGGAQVTNNSTTLTFYTTPAGGAWAAAGTKGSYISFSYETT